MTADQKPAASAPPVVPATVSWRQPRNPCLWLFVALVGYGVYSTVTQVRDAAGLYGPALSLSAVIFACYAVPFWWFTTRIDRYSRLPVSLPVAAFAYGGLAATWVFSVNSNAALIGLLGKLVGPAFALTWGAGIAAPVFEELGKGSGVLLLLFIAPRVVRTAYDGFIAGAFVGLGFEIVEDILYAVNSASEGFGVDQIGSSLQTVALRLATGFTSHIAYASIFGAGVVYLVGTRWQERRAGRGLVLCVAAMLLHGTWNSAAGIAQGNAGVTVVLLATFLLVAAVAVITTFHLTVGPERAAVRAAMLPELDRGLVTREELDTLSGGHRARASYRRRSRDRTARRARRHRLEAAHDLADELGRAGGQETDGVAFARRELARLPGGPAERRSRTTPDLTDQG